MIHKISSLRRLSAIVLVMALLLSVAGCSDSGDGQRASEIPVLQDNSGSFAGDAASGESWAIYWYLCGSDLETDGGYATNDLAEMLEVWLPENVTVVIQTGGALEWWNDAIDSSAMYRLEYSGDELHIADTATNASMGDPDTLADFLSYCETNYPADHKALVFWDHGGGSGSGICYDEIYDNDYLTLPELQNAFASVYGEPGMEMPFELIGFDACLMATIDVAAICSGYAGYMVASEETEPGLGWMYSGWMGALAGNTGMDGAELGRAICDSYYQDCEEWGVEGEITLSVIDLSQIDKVVWALDALSLEGLGSALEGSPAAFFADYGRGAQKADYYSDGGPEMVDLVSLVSENIHLFPETADKLLDSVANSVVYQVTGPYRANSNGISAYFPYAMDTGQYYNVYSAAASPALSYLYEFLFEGEFSDEAQDYLSQAEEFDESLLEDEYEFADVSAYDLEDWEIDVIEEDGVTYAMMDIGPEAAELLQRVTFMLAAYSDDGETVVVLGEEYDLISDWENGVFTDNFRGVWGAIDGHLVMMEVSSITEDYILYDVPILIGGELYSLSVSYLFESGSYHLLTATPDNGGTGITPKEQRLLVPGDEVTTLMYYLDDSGEDGGYYESETFTMTGDSAFHELELPDGIYSFLYVMTDYRNNVYMSELVGVSIEDGFPVMISLD